MDDERSDSATANAAPITPPSLVSESSKPGKSPWTIRGADDVNFQRQAQVTWWSVMGGIGVAALLTQLAPLAQELRSGRWYLLMYFIASALTILVSWITTVWASLILRWPIDVPRVLLVFFTSFCAAAVGLFPTTPASWYVAASFYIASGLLFQLHNLKSNAWIAFPLEAVKRSKWTMVTHAVFFGLAVFGSVILRAYPSHGMQTTWGLVAILACVAALALQHSNMKQERELAGIP